MKSNPFLLLTLFVFATLPAEYCFSQSNAIKYEPPVLLLDFGTKTSPAKNVENQNRRYRETSNSCPDDGFISYVNSIKNCFDGRWHSIMEDHTPGDRDGQMMVVNATEQPGTFFSCDIKGIKPNALYEITFWVTNICKSATGCEPTPPNIRYTIKAENGKLLSNFRTGTIEPATNPIWRKFRGRFSTPEGVSTLKLQFSDDTKGGCGNDFALDDIEVREFSFPEPEPLPVIVKNPDLAPEKAIKPDREKPAEKKVIETEIAQKEIALEKIDTTPAQFPVKTKMEIVKEDPGKQKSFLQVPDKKSPARISPPPAILIKRTNLLAKEIVMEPTDVVIELFDNGTVDGDTITVYHNNIEVISNAALTEKALRLTFKVDKEHPVHEIIMVANNLGSIPPNTSLMLVTAGKERYQFSISSNEQKNAKVILRLKEE